MKFYTKEFYSLLSQCDYLEGLQVIQETDFEKLYQLALEDYIKKAKKSFDTPLFSMNKDFQSKDETANKYAKMISELFADRGDFDLQEAKEEFQDLYQLRLENLNYPQEVLEIIDPRILALGYCTSTVFTLLESIQNTNQIAVSKTVDQEEKSRDSSLKKLYELFNFVEGILTELNIEKSSIHMQIDGYYLDYDLTLNLQFIHGNILENELSEIYNCTIQKIEFYRNHSTLETHLMIYNGEYHYLTIQSEGIIVNGSLFI